MAKSKIAMRAIGVHRERLLAGKPGADMMILQATGRNLKQGGARVSISHADKLGSNRKVDVIFTMARTAPVHRLLEAYEARGVTVINSPRAVADSLNRKLTYSRFKKACIPIPETKVVDIDAVKPEAMKGKFIFKRPDRHEFTKVVSGAGEIRSALDFYRQQGLSEIVIQRFVEGTHVKFYGVGKEIFLPEGIGKQVGKDAIGKLRKYAAKGGEVSGLKIFGGDMIVSGSKIYVVDLNDWPSFSSIRDKAAPKMAKLIEKEHRSRR
jgi:ribosomal protein S6--L-glutamate ligase